MFSFNPALDSSQPAWNSSAHLALPLHPPFPAAFPGDLRGLLRAAAAQARRRGHLQRPHRPRRIGPHLLLLRHPVSACPPAPFPCLPTHLLVARRAPADASTRRTSSFATCMTGEGCNRACRVPLDAHLAGRPACARVLCPRGVPAIKSRINPANWMLEVTSPEAEKRTGMDFAQLYSRSELAAAAAAMVEKHRRGRGRRRCARCAARPARWAAAAGCFPETCARCRGCSLDVWLGAAHLAAHHLRLSRLQHAARGRHPAAPQRAGGLLPLGAAA